MAYSTSPRCMHQQALIISVGLLLGLASMSMLVAGSAEEAPSSHIELMHVDANAGFTGEEPISRAVDRAHLREAMLSPATQGTTRTKVEARHSGHDSYLVELKMEVFSEKENKMVTKEFWVVADTGSDVVWRKQQFKYYIDSMPCDCVKGVSKPSECCSSKLRIFNKKYGTGKKAAKGFMCHEKVTLSQLMLEPKAITLGFAIHYDDHLLPGSADGIVGLNRGNLSMLRQLKVTKFSYCLSKPTKPDERDGEKKIEPEPKTQRKSFFWFGGDNTAAAGTPLVQMPHPTDMYHIALLGISIVGGEYKELPKEYFQHKSTQGDGVMFVDSGCSSTFLETRVFEELKKLLAGELVEPTKKDEFIADEYKGYTCFPDTTPDKKPKLALHFKPTKSNSERDIVVPIQWDNYMVRNKTESKYCLTIYPISGESIMGNILQHDIRMHFDLDNKKLSFKPVADCTNEP